MSFILDALRKLERQRQERSEGEPQTILEGGRRWGSEVRGGLVLWGSVVVALAALILAGVALLESFRLRPERPTQPSATAESPPLRGSSSGPMEPAGAAGGESLMPEAVSAPHEAEAAASPAPQPVPREDGTALRAGGAVEGAIAADEGGIGAEPAVLEAPASAEPQSVRLVGRAAAGEERGPEEPIDPSELEIPEGLPELVLQGTSVFEGRPVAVVNYQRLFEGDFIEGARVVRITETAVELEYKGKRFKIKF